MSGQEQVQGAPDAGRVPVPVQVVFQGGGAKLLLLMAVCSVLEADTRIRVTRVGGSSAGAIAAAMLASNKSIDLHMADLKRIAPGYREKLNTWKLWGALRVATGGAYFKNFSLKALFLEIFGHTKCSELSIETEIYYTSLFSLESRRADPQYTLAEALAKSCNFPFAFVGYSSDTHDVDGGLALNLPVDNMAQDRSKGAVIGIGFSNAFSDPKKGNLFLFTQQLFSAAIQSSVTRSEAILNKDNVFPIDTSIGTFEFDKVFSKDFDTHYLLVQQQFKTWLNTWLEQLPIPAPPIIPPENTVDLQRPILTNSPLLAAIVRDLDDRLKAEPCTHATSLCTYEVAELDAKNNFSGKYLTTNLMTCTIVRLTNVIQFNFQTGMGGTFSDLAFGCTATDSQNTPLKFTANVQELTQPNETIRTFRAYFMFDPPLAPESHHQPYVLRYEYKGEDPYPMLGQKAEASVLTRWQGDAQSIVMAIAFPRSKFKRNPTVTDVHAASAKTLAEANLSLEAKEALIPSDAMTFGEIYAALNPRQAPENFHFYGRRAQNVTQGQAFGLVIEP